METRRSELRALGARPRGDRWLRDVRHVALRMAWPGESALRRGCRKPWTVSTSRGRAAGGVFRTLPARPESPAGGLGPSRVALPGACSPRKPSFCPAAFASLPVCPGNPTGEMQGEHQRGRRTSSGSSPGPVGSAGESASGLAREGSGRRLLDPRTLKWPAGWTQGLRTQEPRRWPGSPGRESLLAACTGRLPTRRRRLAAG